MRVCPRCGCFFEDSESTCSRDREPLDPFVPGPPVVDGTYALDRAIGHGAMGAVVRARHLGLKRMVAVKMLPPASVYDAAARRRFQVEAEALGRLDHPGIVRVTDFGIDPRGNGVPYLVMELLEGPSLRDHLDTLGRLSLAQALPILRGIAEALDTAHHAGALHGDLKPENVLLVEVDQSSRSPKILDFGLAQLSAHPRPPATAELDTSEPVAQGSSDLDGLQHGRTPGSIGYTAPELYGGQPLSTAADLYSLAVIAYELLAGRRPFVGNHNDVVVQQLCCEAPPLTDHQSSLSVEIDEVFAAALSRDPLRRPRSAASLVEQLELAELRLQQKRWRRHERPRRLAMALGSVAVSALAWWILVATGVMEQLENRTVHSRFALRPPAPPDPRLLLLPIGSRSLDADPSPLIGRAAELASTLQAVLDRGASAIGIDIVLPIQWGQSPDFARFVVSSSDRLSLAVAATPAGSVVGAECLGGLPTALLGPRAATSMLSLVNVDRETNGVVYRIRMGCATDSGSTLPTMAARLAEIAGGGPVDALPHRPWIDYSADVSQLERIEWIDIQASVDREPERFRNRIVLVGQEHLGAGDTFHSAPHPRGAPSRLSGLTLQALMVNTLLEEAPIRELAAPAVWTIVLTMSLALGLALFASRNTTQAAAAAAACFVVYLVVSGAVFRWGGVILPVTPVCAALLVSCLLFLALRGTMHPYPRG
jgi:serine/threonine protein kinase